MESEAWVPDLDFQQRNNSAFLGLRHGSGFSYKTKRADYRIAETLGLLSFIEFYSLLTSEICSYDTYYLGDAMDKVTETGIWSQLKI